MHNATLKKISETLGISISTVSRALHNHPDIAEKTKQRVAELAKALDYEPNTSAIQLRTKKSRIFGLIVPSISNFFYESFIASLELECRKENYTLMILQSGDDPAIEEANLKVLRQNRVSGIFICISSSTINMAPFDKMKEYDVPLVFFDKVPEGKYNKVCLGDALSASSAAQVLIAHGKKSIVALFGNNQLSITKRRHEAFVNATQNKTAVSISYAASSDEAEHAVMQGIAKNTDAIFCMSDETLIGAMKAIQRLGLKVPGDISVVAISNGYIPKLYFPEITYAETSGAKLGKIAFEHMIKCKDDIEMCFEETIDSVLVEGGSV